LSGIAFIFSDKEPILWQLVALVLNPGYAKKSLFNQ
jgi:hypothetical protein